MEVSDQAGPQGIQPEHGNIVTIVVNNNPYPIHRGHQTVAAIKEAAGVPAAFQLDELINGTFTPLDDNGAVTIKGDEQFMSYPKGGPFGW